MQKETSAKTNVNMNVQNVRDNLWRVEMPLKAINRSIFLLNSMATLMLNVLMFLSWQIVYGLNFPFINVILYTE